uniref:Guanylate-binding protein N-terminal domain-containing protein n=1 Tax=Jaculus jaculus TaxID=51337 RepID=A0A8C5P0R3_JACJA
MESRKPGLVRVVLVQKDQHSFDLEEKALASILLQDYFRDLDVVVVSVAGLHSQKEGGHSNWLGDSDPETTGIQIWSEIFTMEKPDFNCESLCYHFCFKHHVQIDNLSQNIQENDLQQLQLFTEYGHLAMYEIFQKPFQTLMFLVQYWSFPYEYNYGEMAFLDKCLQVKEHQHEEIQNVQNHIHSCFSDVKCFLLPHPGLQVFKEQLQALTPYVLNPSKLIKKEINGSKVTCWGLLKYFKAYIKIYQGEDLPHPKSMLQATTEGNNLAAAASAKDIYYNNMEDICRGEKAYMSPDILEKHCEFRQLKTKKMVGKDFSFHYQQELEEEIKELYKNFCEHRGSKNIFSTFQTPAVLFTGIAALYVASGLTGFMGLEVVAQLFNSMAGLLLPALLSWGYIRYSGQYRELGRAIDFGAAYALSTISYSTQAAMTDAVIGRPLVD